MTAYFLRRILLVLPTFLGITILVFSITRVVPGGPIEKMLSQMQQMGGEKMAAVKSAEKGAQALSAEQMEELKKYYGFDQPVLKSYFIWLKKVFVLDLGTSTRYQEPVWDIIKSRFPVSILYGLISLLITYLITIPLGIFKAIKHNSLFDNTSSIIVFMGYAIPSYITGIALLFLFSSYWEIFPLGEFVSEEFYDMTFWGKVVDLAWHGVLPIASYVLGSFAVMTFLMKNSLMDNLSADYVRTAIAKGLPFKKAVFKHAMQNSLIPIATSFGNNISVVISGSFLVETIFNIDGFGLLGYEAVIERDYPVVMGILVISSLLFLVGNILSDICVALVDPRVQFK